MLLSELKNIHPNQTIWVIGSGPSLNYLDPRFFDDKICVSINQSGQEFGLLRQYTFCHYHPSEQEHDVFIRMFARSEYVVLPEKEHGDGREWEGEKPANLILFPSHAGRPGVRFDPFGRDDPKPDSLVIGSSSAHGAIHFAAHIGAAHIVLVGVDCGTLDGKHRIDGYHDGHKLWELYDKHLRVMKKWIRERYGVPMYSLNPFVNLNLEGVQFRGNASIN